MRKTKIVCTIGPATSSEKMIKAMILAGMNVARINMSHGKQDDHGIVIQRIRKISMELKRYVSILLDLQGPKIRVEQFESGGVQLKAGQIFTFYKKNVMGGIKGCSTSYPALIRDVRPGDKILLNDGKMEMKALRKTSEYLECRVVNSGRLSDRKGINLPNVPLSTDSVTKKDFSDLEFGLACGVDYVALSFVRHPKDIIRVKKVIQRKKSEAQVIAKIEKPEALAHLGAIVRESDGVMVARGDLGVEIPAEFVPQVQKDLLKMAARYKKLTITATQMLESMIESPSPTRAEASDVANAILDGTDAVMLSGETAVGKYPLEAVSTMDKICRATENSMVFEDSQRNIVFKPGPEIDETICYAACQTVEIQESQALICVTSKGRTARLLSKNRPDVVVLAFSFDRNTLNRLALCWGVVPVFLPKTKNSSELNRKTIDFIEKNRLLKKGDRVVMVYSQHAGISGSSNTLEIREL